MIKYPENYAPDVYEGDDNLRFSLGNDGNNVLFCISINPSKANEEFSDPTMNSLINISKRHGFDGCIMVNPAPYRSTLPRDLPQDVEKDIMDKNIMDKNMQIIDSLFAKHENSTVLCGWGNYVIDGHSWFRESLKKILKSAEDHKMEFVAIQVNNSGQPTHISYLNRDHENFRNGNGNYELQEYKHNLFS